MTKSHTKAVLLEVRRFLEDMASEIELEAGAGTGELCAIEGAEYCRGVVGAFRSTSKYLGRVYLGESPEGKRHPLSLVIDNTRN